MLDFTLNCKELMLRLPCERKLLTDFLAKNGLRADDDLDLALGLFDEEETLLACGCAAGNLLKCFAISERLRGQNILAQLLGALMRNRFALGITELFVITLPKNVFLFQGCGFHLVAQTESAALLENRAGGPERFVRLLNVPAPPSTGKVGALVMNCNPFTLGHLHLIECAAAQCALVHLFVVEEDRSVFPFAERIALVREGCAHLSNVLVHPSGPYIISGKTFPTYFLKQGEDAARVQAALDISIFAERIAPALSIRCRFAGEEPFDSVTRCYNEAMARILPQHNISFCCIPRLHAPGQCISASRVRKLLHEKGLCPELRAFVPEVTFRYLKQKQEGASL